MNARTAVRRWELIAIAFVLSGVMLAYEILDVPRCDYRDR